MTHAWEDARRFHPDHCEALFAASVRTGEALMVALSFAATRFGEAAGEAETKDSAREVAYWLAELENAVRAGYVGPLCRDVAARLMEERLGCRFGVPGLTNLGFGPWKEGAVGFPSWYAWESFTRNTIGRGVKEWALEEKGWPIGRSGFRVRILSDLPTVWMAGTVVRWTPGNLTINVDEKHGAGSCDCWTVELEDDAVDESAPGSCAAPFSVARGWCMPGCGSRIQLSVDLASTDLQDQQYLMRPLTAVLSGHQDAWPLVFTPVARERQVSRVDVVGIIHGAAPQIRRPHAWWALQPAAVAAEGRRGGPAVVRAVRRRARS